MVHKSKEGWDSPERRRQEQRDIKDTRSHHYQPADVGGPEDLLVVNPDGKVDGEVMLLQWKSGVGGVWRHETHFRLGMEMLYL